MTALHTYVDQLGAFKIGNVVKIRPALNVDTSTFELALIAVSPSMVRGPD